MQCCSSVPGSYCELKLAVVELGGFVLFHIVCRLDHACIMMSELLPGRDRRSAGCHFFSLQFVLHFYLHLPTESINGSSEYSSYNMAVRVCTFLKPSSSSHLCLLLLCWKFIVISFKRKETNWRCKNESYYKIVIIYPKLRTVGNILAHWMEYHWTVE